MKPKNTSIKNTPKKSNIIKDSLFAKSFNLAKSNLGKAGLMVLFDALFLASLFYALPTLTKYLADASGLSRYFASGIASPLNAMFLFNFYISSLVYYLMALFAYSFFKYAVLDSIKSLFDRTEFSFKRLGQFYSLNIAIAGIFFAIMLLLNFILASIKPLYQPFVFIFLAVPYLLFLYVIVNTSHSLFYEGASIKESIKKSFSITFTKMKSYRETILAMILFALILLLLFFGSGYLIRLLASKNYTLYLTTYAYFKQASVIIFDVALYLIILINRISFYIISRE